jgi:hypothetical protein
MTWGTIRPVILLPTDSVHWTDEQFRTTVLHELAHVRRCDSLSLLLAFSCCAVLWFNPLVWRCARALRFEAEGAADDLVLAAGVRASDYAAVLLGFSARTLGRNPQSLGGVCRMEQFGIEKRISALLDAYATRTQVTSRQAVTGILACALLLVILCTLRPQTLAAQPQKAGNTAASSGRVPAASRRAAGSVSSSPEHRRRGARSKGSDVIPLTSADAIASSRDRISRSADLIDEQPVPDAQPGASPDLAPQNFTISDPTAQRAISPDDWRSNSRDRPQEKHSITQ